MAVVIMLLDLLSFWLFYVFYYLPFILIQNYLVFGYHLHSSE